MSAYKPTIYLIEDDDDVRHALRTSLLIENHPIQDYSSPLAFLKNYNNQDGCIISDIQMPNMNGLELQSELIRLKIEIPLIFISAHGNIEMAVNTIKHGAFEFIEKPFDQKTLRNCVSLAISHDYENFENKLYKQKILQRYNTLTPREKEIIKLLSDSNGTLTNKLISDLLSISKRTVEVHRSTVMAKMIAQTRSELVTFVKLIDIQDNLTQCKSQDKPNNH